MNGSYRLFRNFCSSHAFRDAKSGHHEKPASPSPCFGGKLKIRHCFSPWLRHNFFLDNTAITMDCNEHFKNWNLLIVTIADAKRVSRTTSNLKCEKWLKMANLMEWFMIKFLIEETLLAISVIQLHSPYKHHFLQYSLLHICSSRQDSVCAQQKVSKKL